MNFKNSQKSADHSSFRRQKIASAQKKENSNLRNIQEITEKSSQVRQLMALNQLVQKKSQKAESNPPSSPLPDQLRSGIEQLSGLSMSDVTVNYDSAKPSQVGALAYAQGSDIHLGPNQEKHLPHEAWHVVQQKTKNVKPTNSINGIPINDSNTLEKEADRMGNKAQSLGKDSSKVIQQINLSKREKGIIQKKEPNPESEAPLESTEPEETIDPVHLAKLSKYKGLISMAKNAKKVLNNSKIWNSVTDQTDYLGGGIVATGLAGSLTLAGSKSSKKIKELTQDNPSISAEEISSGIGSIIQDLFGIIGSIKSLVQSFKGSDPMKNPQRGREIMNSVRLGLKTANVIKKFVDGKIVPGFDKAIPGLGIAISAADVMINLHNILKAKNAESEMTGISLKYKDQLTGIFGGEPEKKASKIFEIETRGKVFHKKGYLRIKPGLMGELIKIAGESDIESNFDKFKSDHNLASNIQFSDFYPALRSYELGSKLQEINQKRKIHGGNKVFTALLSIAGNIAAFFPADGGITAATLQGSSSAINGALAGGKFIQQVGRNRGWMGADRNRSSSSKHKEYVQHARTIYMILEQSGLEGKDEMSLETRQIDQIIPVESMIKASGASPDTVYQTNYSNDTSVFRQIKLIVESMKKGRG